MKEILPGLFLINLDQPITGFRNFISSWILKGANTTILIDPGPSSSIVHLSGALNKMGIRHIDYILLTHIHIDHAGGTGLLLQKYPEAQVVCHPRGISHLVNPEKLWEGTLKVLGKLADVYGPISEVAEEKLSFVEQIKTNDFSIRVIETPGHASHHVSYLTDDLLFIGEAAGVNIPLSRGSYLRIATPPVFKYEIFRSSLEKIADLGSSHLCFAHYGYRNTAVAGVIKTAVDQLELWMEIIEKHLDRGNNEEDQILADILQKDPSLKHFEALPRDIQSRESYFCKNSIKGIMGYFSDKAEG